LGLFGGKFAEKMLEFVREIIFFSEIQRTINFESNAEILQARAKKLHF